MTSRCPNTSERSGQRELLRKAQHRQEKGSEVKESSPSYLNTCSEKGNRNVSREPLMALKRHRPVRRQKRSSVPCSSSRGETCKPAWKHDWPIGAAMAVSSWSFGRQALASRGRRADEWIRTEAGAVIKGRRGAEAWARFDPDKPGHGVPLQLSIN